jgi:hypothetical protein
MGFLWDLVQQSQISNAQQQNASLAERVASLESELRHTRELLHTLIARLEQNLRTDLDADGQIG